MRLLLIANPTAGNNGPDHIETARRTLAQHGAEVELFLTGASGDAEKRAREVRQGPFARVIAAGGDGTLNEVVNGLAGSDTPLGFIPLGTTNVFALETGIPFDVAEAATIAYTGSPRTVTLGKAGPRYFLLMAGAGFDGQVVARVSSRLKKWLGKGAYLVAALQQLMAHPPRLFEVNIQGRRIQAAGLVLANARCYGGRFTLTPAAKLTTPTLDLCLLERPGRLALLRQALSLVSGRPLPRSLGSLQKVTTLRIETVGIPVQIDGDFLGESPLEFCCEAAALQLVYPPDLPTGQTS